MMKSYYFTPFLPLVPYINYRIRQWLVAYSAPTLSFGPTMTNRYQNPTPSYSIVTITWLVCHVCLHRKRSFTMFKVRFLLWNQMKGNCLLIYKSYLSSFISRILARFMVDFHCALDTEWCRIIIFLGRMTRLSMYVLLTLIISMWFRLRVFPSICNYIILH